MNNGMSWFEAELREIDKINKKTKAGKLEVKQRKKKLFHDLMDSCCYEYLKIDEAKIRRGE